MCLRIVAQLVEKQTALRLTLKSKAVNWTQEWLGLSAPWASSLVWMECFFFFSDVLQFGPRDHQAENPSSGVSMWQPDTLLSRVQREQTSAQTHSASLRETCCFFTFNSWRNTACYLFALNNLLIPRLRLWSNVGPVGLLSPKTMFPLHVELCKT